MPKEARGQLCRCIAFPHHGYQKNCGSLFDGSELGADPGSFGYPSCQSATASNAKPGFPCLAAIIACPGTVLPHVCLGQRIVNNRLASRPILSRPLPGAVYRQERTPRNAAIIVAVRRNRFSAVGKRRGGSPRLASKGDLVYVPTKLIAEKSTGVRHPRTGDLTRPSGPVNFSVPVNRRATESVKIPISSSRWMGRS